MKYLNNVEVEQLLKSECINMYWVHERKVRVGVSDIVTNLKF
jgi:hypothetical protein